jgi:hypothetical protein
MHPALSGPASGGVMQVGPQVHAPPWQSQSTEPPHATACVRYPQVAPCAVQELPLWGTSCGQGACQVPARHWQLDSQPAMPPVQTCVSEHPQPSRQASAWWPSLSGPHAPKSMASIAAAAALATVNPNAR